MEHRMEDADHALISMGSSLPSARLPQTHCVNRDCGLESSECGLIGRFLPKPLPRL